MDSANLDTILEEIPLFAALTATERSLIKQKSVFAQFKKGGIVYREGDPPDAFYCVILGRIVIYTQDERGNQTLLESLHRGKYFGIISLLTGEGHSVTAQAVNDSLLLVIKKEDFNFILNKIPRLAIDLSRTLSRRLKRKDFHQKTIFESTIVAVFSSYSRAGKSIYALNLALSLIQETHKPVLIVDIVQQERTHSLPRRLDIKDEYKIFDLSRPDYIPGDLKGHILKTAFGTGLLCVHYEAENDSSARNLTEILSILVNDYNFIIVDLPAAMDKSVLNMLNQADSIHIISSPDSVDLERTRVLIEKLKSEFNFQEDKIKTVINEYKLSKLRTERQAAILDSKIYATLPKIGLGKGDKMVLNDPDSEYAKAVRRISRQLGDCLVGLALGVGAAYGFCHIGVLKVIEEEKIPIDVIAGSSVGAVIAALWATGKSSREILDICREFRQPKFIWNVVDLTFPTLGFIKGKKLYNFLKKHLGQKTFYDVRLPLKIIASDVKKKETRVLDKGILADAIMASCSMPGVFMPFRFREEILFDGGVISPLPTEPLFKLGVKKIIAVNVTPSREDVLRQYERIKGVMGPKVEQAEKKKWQGLGHYFRNKFKTNILDYIFSSFEILQSEVAQKESQLADVVLHPDTHGLFWLELHRAEEFAKRGEEEARRQLDKIRQIINE